MTDSAPNKAGAPLQLTKKRCVTHGKAIAVLPTKPPKLSDPARATWVRLRIVALSRVASTRFIENGTLLWELRDRGYWREWNYPTFDACITDLQEKGQVEYGPRNARHFIAVVEMIDAHHLDKKDVGKIAISKLREIASVPDMKAQQRLLAVANDTSVADMQQMARVERAKAKGYDVDPLHPVTLMFTETQRTMYKECIEYGRAVYGMEETSPEANVLETILADWRSGAPNVETVDAEPV